MKLQVALDRLTYEECFNIISKIFPYTDIVEIGTGVIKEYGLGLVKSIKEEYPELIVLADVKICDAGESESETAFNYGADIITVMSFSDIKTIKDCIRVAEKYDGKVVVDLLNNHSADTLATLKQAGVKNISVHLGKDQQQSADHSMGKLADILKEYDLKTFYAGGINEHNVYNYLKYEPDVIIVGSGITSNENPENAAKTIKRIINDEKV